MALVAVLLATGGAVPIAARPGAAGSANLCRPAERVVYSCNFGRKVSSLCLGKHSINYRFGPIGRPELDLGNTLDWSNVFTHELYSHALSQTHVRMTKGQVSYIVYWGETGNLSDVPGRIFSGVTMIEGSNKTVAELPCKRATKVDWSAFNDITNSAPAGWVSDEESDGPFDGYF